MITEEKSTKTIYEEECVPDNIDYTKSIFHVGERMAGRIFIKGEAGCGKTMFCLNLLRNWCRAKKTVHTFDTKEQEILSSFDLVFYIPLRAVKNCTTIVDMICDTSSKGSEEATRRIKLLLLERKFRSLILLDGLDEWVPPAEFIGLPKSSGLANSVLLFTTRPWKIIQLQFKYRFDDKLLIISGLIPSSISQVMKSVLVHFYGLEEDSSQFKNAFHILEQLVNNPSLERLLHIPMTLVNACYFWYEQNFETGRSITTNGKNDNIDTIQGSFTIFHLSVLETLLKQASEKYDYLFHTDLSYSSSIPQTIFSFGRVHHHIGKILPVCELAFKGLSKETLIIDQNCQLERNIEKDITPILETAFKIGCITQSKTPGRFHQQNVSINFYDKNVKEFMASLCITCGDIDILKEFCNILSSLDVVLEHSGIILFIMGVAPKIGSRVAKHVCGVADTDSRVKDHRANFQKSKIVKMLFKTQLQWYIEMRETLHLTGNTSNVSPFYISDVYLDSEADTKTLETTTEIIQNYERIVSVSLFSGLNRSLGNILQMLLSFPNLSTLWISHLGKDHCLLPPVLPRLSQIQRVRYDGTYNTSQKNVTPDVSGDMAVVLAISQLNQLKHLELHNINLDTFKVIWPLENSELSDIVFDDLSLSSECWEKFGTFVDQMNQNVHVTLCNTNINEGALSTLSNLKNVQVYIRLHSHKSEGDRDAWYWMARLAHLITLWSQ